MAEEKDWKESIPEELRSDPSIRDYKTVADVAKALKETKAFVGASIRPPGPDASPEAKKDFLERLQKAAPELVNLDAADPEVLWRKLGRPEKIEDYSIPADRAGAINAEETRALAKAMGLTKAQFEKLTETMAGGVETQRQSAREGAEKLKAEWGQAFEQNLLLAKGTAMKMGLSDAEVAGLSPSQLRAWAATAKAVGVNPTNLAMQQDGGGGGGRLTPAEARAQLAEIRARPEYFDRYKNPALHDQLVRKVVELTAASLPG